MSLTFVEEPQTTTDNIHLEGVLAAEDQLLSSDLTRISLRVTIITQQVFICGGLAEVLVLDRDLPGSPSSRLSQDFNAWDETKS